MTDVERVVESLRKHERLLLACHVDPDPDCVGSMLAIDWLLEKMGKTSLPLSQDPMLPQWSFLPRIERVTLAEEAEMFQQEEWDALVVVDCDVGRTGRASHWAKRVNEVINIDHHVTNPGSGAVNLIRPDASAAGEIVYDLITSANISLDKDVSTLLYAAIMADTGSFRFSNTTPRAFEVASQLVRSGARPEQISGEIYDRRSWNYLRLLARVLETLDRSDDGKVAWIELTNEMLREEGVRRDETEGLIQYPRMIDGVEVALIFRELDGEQVRVGFRSRGWVDVSALAQEFGGGGHARAAGCTVTGSLNEVRERVVTRAIEVADAGISR